jgi:hypothetical protein
MASHILERLTNYYKVKDVMHYEVAIFDQSENLVGFLDESGFRHVHEARAKLILVDAQRILASPDADSLYNTSHSLVVVKHVETDTIITWRVH